MGSKHHTKLTAKERDLMAVWRGGGVGIREIAKRLGRSPGTVCEEIKRNSFWASIRDGRRRRYYIAIHAQAKAEKRAKIARVRHPLKDQVTYSYVVSKLGMGWSPEIIAGRLRKRYGKTKICHETIYRFVYSGSRQAQRLKLWEYLVRRQTKRRKRLGRKVIRIHIPGRVSIHLRPAQVATRQILGHWEGDTMEGKGHKDGIHVEAERLSRKRMAKIISRIDGEETLAAQLSMFSLLPPKARKSTTMDNGKENHLHTKLRRLGITTYFCDPYSPWQKGTVENSIGLVRRYLPKGTDLSSLTQEELDDIIEELNNRPMKVLNYNTPNEVFESYNNVRIQLRM